MAKSLVAVVPLDAQIDDLVRELQAAGVEDLRFIVLSEATGFPQVKGFALQPQVMTVLQMLPHDTKVSVEGLGELIVTGGQGRADAQEFVTGLLDEQAQGGASLRQHLRDRHAVLAIGGDHDQARAILQRRNAILV